jgi:peptidoglycan/LPS O-acetylase OafA/YrhL
VYLFHRPVLELFIRLNIFENAYVFPISFFVTVSMALISYNVFEVPASNFIKSKFSSPQSANNFGNISETRSDKKIPEK